MNRVLVTGAAGFLGRWFTEYHLNRGDEVIQVDNLQNPHSSWLGEPGIKKDLAAYLYKADEVFDLAYHFAAPVGGRLKIEGDPLFNADSLRLDSLFFRWACGRVGIVIYPSSSAVYGTKLQRGAGIDLSEDLFTPNGPLWYVPDEMYGFTKLAGEMLAWKAAQYGLNTLCIRPFSGYGEGQSLEYPVPSICLRAKNQEDPLMVWGSGMQMRDFIHVEDLVEATAARLARGIQGYQVMNIGTGVATPFVEIARLAAKIVGYQPVIKTDVTKPAGVENRRADIEVMRRFYTPRIGLEHGLERVIRSL